MIAGRMLCTLARSGQRLCGPRRLTTHVPNLITANQQTTSIMACRLLSSFQVSRNIEFVPKDTKATSAGSSLKNYDQEPRPLLVLLSWLMSNRKHVMKYASLYMEQGFDVAVVTITPWQLLWPTKGSRLVAQDLLKYLVQDSTHQQILLHGFSVGGYLWGEVLDIVHADREKYDPVIQKIIGQVWDSLADITEISIGTPRAIFPNNKVLQNMLQKYIEYHMKAFYKQSTQYYIRSSQLFHTSLLRAPALFFVSNSDPVGTLSGNMRVRDSWDSLGVTTYVKVFEKSAHVGHFHKYPKEYVAELYAFLSKLNLIQNREKITARL